MNYDFGLNTSIALGAAYGVIVVGIVLYDGITTLDEPDGVYRLFNFLLLLFYATTAAFSFQLFIFSIVNFGFNVHTFGLREVISQEIASGKLALRVVSILVGFQVAVRIFNHVLVEETMSTNFRLLTFAKSQHKDLADLPELFDNGDTEKITLSQFSIYLVALFVLWNCVHSSIENIYTTSLSFALFFVVDDWIILSHYLEALKGRILQRHIIRIAVLNGIIILAISIILIRYFHLFFAGSLILLIAILSSIHYAWLFWGIEASPKSDA